MRTVVVIIGLIFSGANAMGQGTVHFINRLGGAQGVDAPFFNKEGIRLEGPDYLVQLYAWIPFEGYVPAGQSVEFLTNGYFNGGAVTVPVPPGWPVWVHVRAWAAAGGASFEEAALNGSWTGTSNEIYLPFTGSPHSLPPFVPPLLIGLTYPGKPWIVRHPKSQVIRPRARAELSVVASSGVASTYQWYEATQPGESPFDRPIEGATNAVYRTPLLEARASYAVEVSNEAGSTMSETATVYVAEVEPRLGVALVSGQPAVTVTASPDIPYRLERSASLTEAVWQSLAEVTLSGGSFTFQDTVAGAGPARFYRLRLAPK